MAFKALALLVVFVAAAAAQVPPTAPNCVAQCAGTSIADSGCHSNTDVVCLCSSPTFRSEYDACISRTCSAQDAATGADLFNSICLPAASSSASSIGTVSSTSSGTGAHSTGSAASSGSSSGTSHSAAPSSSHSATSSSAAPKPTTNAPSSSPTAVVTPSSSVTPTSQTLPVSITSTTSTVLSQPTGALSIPASVNNRPSSQSSINFSVTGPSGGAPSPTAAANNAGTRLAGLPRAAVMVAVGVLAAVLA